MEKVIKKISLKDRTNYDLDYWLSKTPEERISAVEFLRKQLYGDESERRLQRVVTITKRSRS